MTFVRLDIQKDLQTCEQSRGCVKGSQGVQQPHSSCSSDEHIRGGQFGCVDFDFGCFGVDCDLETHGPILLPSVRRH